MKRKCLNCKTFNYGGEHDCCDKPRFKKPPKQTERQNRTEQHLAELIAKLEKEEKQ